MKIDKAIEILTMATGKGGIATDDDYIDAQKLGCEALKHVGNMRISPCTTADEILPGETE